MKNVKIVFSNEMYTLDGFDVSVEEWIEMIKNTNVFDDKSIEMIKHWYYEDNHSSSSKILTIKYHPESSKSPYNGIVEGLGRRVLNYLNRYEIEFDEIDHISYWITVFDGWYDGNSFIWRLKDNICKALEELKYVEDIEISRPRFWLFPCNIEYYNVYGAFEKYSELYWRQNLKQIKVGDRVFIYVSKPESKIAYYCETLEIDVDQDKAKIIDDSAFYLNNGTTHDLDKFVSHDRYVKLRLLKRIYDDRLNLKQLNRNGVKGNIQGQQEINGKALKYVLDRINHCYLDIKELEENIEVFKSAYLEEEQKKFKSCEIERKKFIKKFPKEKIYTIELKDYCLGLDTYDNFCYYLENRLSASGSIKGGSAYKFGVFFSKKNNRFEVVEKWSKEKNEIEALENIKKSIDEVIKAGEFYDFYTLENNKLSVVVKGKILASYYPKQYIGIFGDEDFNYFFYKLGIPFNDKLSAVRKQYQLLKLKQENRVFDALSFEEFMSFLYTMYGRELLAKKKEDNKRNFIKSDNFKKDFIQGNNKLVKRKLIKEDFYFIGNRKNEINSKRKGPVNFESLQKKRTAVGFLGELLVLEYETEILKASGSKLRPEHVALIDPSAGYDILSYDENGKAKYIEVKTRKNKTNTKLDFYITVNEREKFENLEGYVIYFVSDLNSDTPKLRVITKEIYLQLDLQPIAFRIIADIKVTS